MKKVILTLAAILLASCAAKADKKLVIYSPHSQQLLEDVADRFEKDTGIKVEFISTGTDAVVSRLMAEKANPQADIMYGGSATYFEQLKRDEILEKSQPSWAKNIGTSFVDKDGYWYGPMQTPAVLFYNTNTMKAEELPADWLDITNVKYKGKLRWLRAGGTANTYISVMTYLFDKGNDLKSARQWLSAFNDNVAAYYADGGTMYNDINSKDGGLSMFVLPYIADGIYNLSYPWAVIPTKSGVINIIDSIAAVKNSPNPEGAQKFMEWVGSKENMVILAQKFNRMPTDPAALAESPQWMKDFTMVSMDIDWALISQKSGEWVQYFFDNIRNK